MKRRVSLRARAASDRFAAIYLVTTLASIALFIRHEAKARKPLLPLQVFGRPAFSLSTITSLCSYTGQGLALVSLPFFFQTSLGRTPFEASLLLTPWPISVALVARLAGRLADRFAVAILGTAGLTLMAFGAAMLALLPDRPTIPDIIWREMLCGLGFGFFQAPNNREIMSSLPDQFTSVAAGMLATARVFGQSLGVAAVTHDPTHIDTTRNAMPLALWMATAVAAVGAAVSALRLRPQVDESSPR